ncbi:MAG: 50S ribosomal protein L5 [archaeon]
MNPMRNIRIEKITLNIGAGTDQDVMKRGIKLIELLTGKTPVKTTTQKRIPGWNLRPGLPIGCKLTLRNEEAEAILKRLLTAKENKLKKSCFDSNGNISFGLSEYIDVPGLNYDPAIGVIGLETSVTLERPGFRIKKRKLECKKLPKKHKITQDEAIVYFKKDFNVLVEEN